MVWHLREESGTASVSAREGTAAAQAALHCSGFVLVFVLFALLFVCLWDIKECPNITHASLELDL